MHTHFMCQNDKMRCQNEKVTINLMRFILPYAFVSLTHWRLSCTWHAFCVYLSYSVYSMQVNHERTVAVKCQW